MKKLFRSANDKKLLGVCGGLARYFGIDPTIVRLGWIIVSIIPAVGPVVGVVAYIVCGFVIPMEKDYIDITEYKDSDE